MSGENSTEPETLLHRARALEGSSAWPEAVAAWSRLVDAAPGFLPAQLSLAQTQIRAGRPHDALPVLERLQPQAPDLPALWLALAVTNSMLGRHDAAIAAAERAVALAPELPAVHLGLGDVRRQAGHTEAASAAYARAVHLAPDDVDALNKLATMRRVLRDGTGAQEILERALALAPRHPYVRVNAATLALQSGELEKGKRELESALNDPGMPRDAYAEAREALAMLEEDDALAGPIEQAVDSNAPARLATALRARPRGGVPDERLVRFFRRIVERHERQAGVSGRFARGAPRSSAWNAIEAHHHFRSTRTSDAIGRDIGNVGSEGSERTRKDLDVAHCARLVDDAGAVAFDERDPVEFEALMRWTHARLMRHRPERRPGKFKLGGYRLLGMHHLSDCSPTMTQATLDVVLRDLSPRLAEAPVRYAFLHIALVSMQAFADGNTRVGRFLLNRALTRAGFYPSLRPASGDRRILHIVEATADLEPLIASLAAGSHEAAARDREWAARVPLTR